MGQVNILDLISKYLNGAKFDCDTEKNYMII